METKGPFLPIDNTENEANNELIKEKPFSDEAMIALREFGDVLQEIHNRLVSEGVVIEVDAHYAKRNGNNRSGHN